MLKLLQLRASNGEAGCRAINTRPLKTSHDFVRLMFTHEEERRENTCSSDGGISSATSRYKAYSLDALEPYLLNTSSTM